MMGGWNLFKIPNETLPESWEGKIGAWGMFKELTTACRPYIYCSMDSTSADGVRWLDDLGPIDGHQVTTPYSSIWTVTVVRFLFRVGKGLRWKQALLWDRAFHVLNFTDFLRPYIIAMAFVMCNGETGWNMHGSVCIPLSDSQAFNVILQFRHRKLEDCAIPQTSNSQWLTRSGKFIIYNILANADH